jgi:hypothetical protein
MNKHLDNTPDGQTPDRATPANTENPAPAMEPEHNRSANDQPITSNARKRKAGASGPKRKKKFIL